LIKIHCFEPGYKAYEELNKSYSNNSLIKLNNFAIGRCTGQANLFFDHDGSGLASLTKRRLNHFDILFQ